MIISDIPVDSDESIPTEIRLTENTLQLTYDHLGAPVIFTRHFLRCASPVSSACIHNIDSRISIDTVEAVGEYAVRLKFSDGFENGIYNWSYLHWLSKMQATLVDSWQHQEQDDEPFAIYSCYRAACKKRLSETDMKEQAMLPE